MRPEMKTLRTSVLLLAVLALCPATGLAQSGPDLMQAALDAQADRLSGIENVIEHQHLNAADRFQQLHFRCAGHRIVTLPDLAQQLVKITESSADPLGQRQLPEDRHRKSALSDGME